MADTKTSDLSVLTAPAMGDFLKLVDVSDTTFSANGTDKQATLATLGVPIKIQTITDPGSGIFDFSTIPTGGRDLIFDGWVRSTESGVTDTLRAYINSDTTDANYHFQRTDADDGPSFPNGADGSAPSAGRAPADGSPSGSYGRLTIVVPAYDSTSVLKMMDLRCISYLDTDRLSHTSVGVVSAITAAVTRFRVQLDGYAGTGDSMVGTMSMYVRG